MLAERTCVRTPQREILLDERHNAPAAHFRAARAVDDHERPRHDDTLGIHDRLRELLERAARRKHIVGHQGPFARLRLRGVEDELFLLPLPSLLREDCVDRPLVILAKVPRGGGELIGERNRAKLNAAHEIELLERKLRFRERPQRLIHDIDQADRVAHDEPAVDVRTRMAPRSEERVRLLRVAPVLPPASYFPVPFDPALLSTHHLPPSCSHTQVQVPQAP